ncbi:MAG: hypothetical protein WD578_10445 [Bacteroidales bacterium]
MNQLKTRQIFASVIFVIAFSCIFPSCATPRRSTLEKQRQGLMMQDKSEYRRNKSKYKGSASYRQQQRRSKYYKKNVIRK